jgi:hypothetical protein
MCNRAVLESVPYLHVHFVVISFGLQILSNERPYPVTGLSADPRSRCTLDGVCVKHIVLATKTYWVCCQILLFGHWHVFYYQLGLRFTNDRKVEEFVKFAVDSGQPNGHCYLGTALCPDHHRVTRRQGFSAVVSRIS